MVILKPPWVLPIVSLSFTCHSHFALDRHENTLSIPTNLVPPLTFPAGSRRSCLIVISRRAATCFGLSGSAVITFIFLDWVTQEPARCSTLALLPHSRLPFLSSWRFRCTPFLVRPSSHHAALFPYRQEPHSLLPVLFRTRYVVN